MSINNEFAPAEDDYIDESFAQSSKKDKDDDEKIYLFGKNGKENDND